ncbi:MAG: hypothetical protein FJ356_05945, partial [Thaumarchaeota archaeon]|nr:hypothetical protein [Nitrososphaerota archaeon]
FANYTQELQRYDVLSNYPLLQDKIAVWGEVQKKYLVEYKNFEPKRIFVTGSPRHDIFFTREPIQQHNKQQNVLLTIIPITNITGHASTNAHIKFETFIHELCRILKKLNLTLVVKLHPGQAEHNEEIIDLFQSIDTTIPVYQINPILDLIESCDFMININPESCDTSTVIMEGLIMRKPVLTVFLDNKHHEIEFVKDNATISISDHSDLEWAINDILTDETRSRLRKNTEVHLSKYLSNQGTASQRFAALLGLL